MNEVQSGVFDTEQVPRILKIVKLQGFHHLVYRLSMKSMQSCFLGYFTMALQKLRRYVVLKACLVHHRSQSLCTWYHAVLIIPQDIRFSQTDDI